MTFELLITFDRLNNQCSVAGPCRNKALCRQMLAAAADAVNSCETVTNCNPTNFQMHVVFDQAAGVVNIDGPLGNKASVIAPSKRPGAG